MTDVVLLLVAAAVLALLGVLAAGGWAADSRDPSYTAGAAFAAPADEPERVP